MSEKSTGEITVLLENLRDGQEEAVEDLIAVVYRELRKSASLLLRKERQGHTLRATDVVHEAYLRLFGDEDFDWENRAHFFGSAAVAMRRVLIDYARKKKAGKRIPKEEMVPIDLADSPLLLPNLDLLALDQALTRLAEVDSRKARIVELRYFGGMGEGEVAEILGVSRMTVTRDWRIAKLWLRREMKR